MEILLFFLMIIFNFRCYTSTKSIPFQEKYINQNIDHFTYYNKEFNETTFPQRYLIQDKWWKRPDGPIFFYTGNEGPIDAFWNNTGFVFDIAPHFKALVIFAEHRYYGKSLPFPVSKCFTHPYVDLLTVEQALADYAVLLTTLKEQLNATGPVIAFGGSYGGMLTAYMRFKYPNVIQGGLAASAPIFLVSGHASRDFFFADVSKDFINAGCGDKVRQGFIDLNTMAAKGAQGLKEISSTFHLCSSLTSQSDYRHLLLWLRNAFTNLAMLDYPYPTHLFVSLPGYPVKAACKSMLSAKSAAIGLSQVANIYYGSSSCHNIHTEYIECADPTGCGLGPDSKAWDYQACTELPMPAGSNNVTDLFPEISFTLQERQRYCSKVWGIEGRNDWFGVQMWGKNIGSSSNLVFSNGDLDPWHRGGVLNNVTSFITSVIIKGGAHHLDLRGSHPLDPPSVKSVREFEVHQINMWIQTYYRTRDTV